jgi:hypothetical protein
MRIKLLILCVVIILSVACVEEAADQQENGDGTGVTTPGAGLDGKYAQLNVVAYYDETTATDQLIISYGLAVIRQEGDAYLLDEEYCHAEHISTMPIISVMPDEATRSILPTTATLEITREQGALVIKRPAIPTPVGIRLEDPSEPLPSDTNDPRIWDQDGDGNPGFTVHIESTVESSAMAISGEIYVIRREIFAYELVVREDGIFEGTITDSSEQLVLGSTNPLFDLEQRWVQKSDRSQSPLVFVPVDANLDCDALMQDADDILPPAPTLD